VNTNGEISVPELQALLPGAVLLPIPARQKGPRFKGWSQLSFEQTQAWEYQQALRQARNTGVLLGPASGNLVAIDIDSDSYIEEFLRLNPPLASTLRSRGQNGCQLWLYLVGEYKEAVYYLRTSEGQDWGEWRGGGGAESVIRGIHPAGMTYRLLVKALPVTLSFDALHWPPALRWTEKERSPGVRQARPADKESEADRILRQEGFNA
jgi:Bifunctional DNA primase/polymerase, N-terminal